VTKPRRIPKAEVLEKERRALEMRRAGADYASIAAQLGYANKGGAHKAVTSALARTIGETVEDAGELRRVEADRLDRLQLAIWPQAMRGDLNAVDRVLRLFERRARLLGLDAAPARFEAMPTGDIIIQFGIPRPDPRASDQAAVPQAALRALPGGA
jgi:hypothetical protein